MYGILRIPPFVNHKGKDIKSDWFADQLDKRSVLGHAQFHEGRVKCDDPEINTAQTPKRLDGCLAVQEKIRMTFTDRIPKNILIFIVFTALGSLLTTVAAALHLFL